MNQLPVAVSYTAVSLEDSLGRPATEVKLVPAKPKAETGDPTTEALDASLAKLPQALLAAQAPWAISGIQVTEALIRRIPRILLFEQSMLLSLIAQSIRRHVKILMSG